MGTISERELSMTTVLWSPHPAQRDGRVPGPQPRASLDISGNGCEERGFADGLSEIIGEASDLTLLFRFFEGVGGERDHGKWWAFAGGFPVAKLFGCLVAVHHGHVDVHQDKIVFGIEHFLERDSTVFGEVQLYTAVFFK